MKKQLEQLAEFHEAFNVDMPKIPSFPDLETALLRDRLIREEVDEMMEAYHEKDFVKFTDGLIDCFYILFGTATKMGITKGELLERLFNEVHRSNMSKLDENGKPIFREDGKVLKGPNYTPPNLSPILEDWLENEDDTLY